MPRAKYGPGERARERVAETVERARAQSPRQHLYMREARTGLFLGKDGKWIRTRSHARRFNPAQAREFLTKARAVRWEVN